MNKILDTKEVILNPRDGKSILNLQDPSYDTNLELVPISGVGIVTDMMESRGDVFAQVYANDFKDEFDILKYNRISNPFSLKAGDFLGLPVFPTLEKTKMTEERRKELKKSESNSKDDIRKRLKEQYNPFPKENVKSNSFEAFKNKYAKIQELKDLENAKKLQTGNINDSENLLPPNFADRNKNEITVTPNGTVVLGTSVAETDSTCGKNTLTKAEILNTIIKNRIIK